MEIHTQWPLFMFISGSLSYNQDTRKYKYLVKKKKCSVCILTENVFQLNLGQCKKRCFYLFFLYFTVSVALLLALPMVNFTTPLMSVLVFFSLSLYVVPWFSRCTEGPG